LRPGISDRGFAGYRGGDASPASLSTPVVRAKQPMPASSSDHRTCSAHQTCSWHHHGVSAKHLPRYLREWSSGSIVKRDGLTVTSRRQCATITYDQLRRALCPWRQSRPAASRGGCAACSADRETRGTHACSCKI
jgi:hypothetical protein